LETARVQSWDEHLDFLMDLMRQPWLRNWARTDWSSREEEWNALRKIYRIDPHSTDTIIHPIQNDRETVKGRAVYSYPLEADKSSKFQVPSSKLQTGE
jgi:hypothetical protein